MATPRSCLPILLVALLPLLASATTNLTAPGDATVYFTIQSGYNPDYTARCLNAGDDDNAVLEECSDGAASQLWSLQGDTLVNANGKCLDVCKGLSCYNFFKGATQVIVYDCNGGDNQKWTSAAASLISASNGACLEMCDSCDPQYSAITNACDKGSDEQQFGFSLADAPAV